MDPEGAEDAEQGRQGQGDADRQPGGGDKAHGGGEEEKLRPDTGGMKTDYFVDSVVGVVFVISMLNFFSCLFFE